MSRTVFLNCPWFKNWNQLTEHSIEDSFEIEFYITSEGSIGYAVNSGVRHGIDDPHSSPFHFSQNEYNIRGERGGCRRGKAFKKNLIRKESEIE